MTPKWMDVARRFEGTKEIRGKRHNPQVVKFFELVGHPEVKNDETAWCAAFVGSSLALAKLAHTGSLLAKSYLKYGTAISKPKYGCIVVFDPTRKNAKPWQGHVGFYVGETATRIKVLGGNQTNQVRVSTYPKNKVRGYRWPKELKSSRTIKAAGAANGALLGSGIMGASEQSLTEQLSTWQGFTEWLPMAKWICIGIALLLLFRIVWAKVDDNATQGSDLELEEALLREGGQP